MATTRNQYAPDAVIPTEQVLKGYIEDLGISQHDLALKCGYTPEIVSKIISGETRIDENIANQLEQSLGLKAYIWLGIERKYQDFLARGASDKNGALAVAEQ